MARPLPFALRHALRELRSSWRRLGLHMAAIALGVAALVAINSFRAAVEGSVAEEGRALLGADVRLEASVPLDSGDVGAVLDTLAARGVPIARVTRLASMVMARPSGDVRLLQVRAVEGGWPFYGPVETSPAGRWPLAPDAPRALVDPAVLVQLDAAVGDTLLIGEARFVIDGTVEDLTGDVAIQTAIGPRVWIPRARLGDTGLDRYGSIIQHQAYLRMQDPAPLEAATGGDPDAFFRPRLVDYDTAREQLDRLTDSLGAVGRFLGLVALMALLLGGVGVGSAVNVFVRERLASAAVLRCVGASQRTVFAAYLLETTALALAGAAAGALLGLAVQAALPLVLGGFLPVAVGFRVYFGPVLAGLAIGAWVGALFALLPLLGVRGVAPLEALRSGFDSRTSFLRDPWRWLTLGALAATVTALAVWQAPTPAVGLGFAGGLAGVLLLLWAAAFALLRLLRRGFPARAPFVVRQGVANLHRPRNQTVAVTLALGLGVFLVTSTWLVQSNLLDRLRVDPSRDRPNLLLFDIQTDQVAGVRALADSLAVPLGDLTPLVSARLAALNGTPVGELLADSLVEPWAVRRDYRNTYRDSLVATEELVAGAWFDRDARPPGSPGLPRISLEEGVAEELGVGVGDRITWDVQGRAIETEITNLRRVDWARFAPNFFVVFEPGVLERAPQTVIALARAPGGSSAELQRALVRRYPNVSALDLARVQEAVEGVLSRVTAAVRFLGLFTVAAGLVVLAGALSATRHQRLRESALLRTLGARRGQVASVLVVEYVAVGLLAAFIGATLATLGGWALVTRWFDLPFRLPVVGLLVIAAGAAAVTAGVAWLGGRDVVTRSPVVMLRETEEA